MAEQPDAKPGPAKVVRFGVFEADLQSGELRKRGVKIRLQQQPFRVLELLLERPGEVVPREHLRERLWASDTWVDFDHGLNKAVNKLRETLGDSADSPRFIETLAKRGYRFVAPVQVVVDRALRVPLVTPTADPAPSTERPAMETGSVDGPKTPDRRSRGVRYAFAVAALGGAAALAFVIWGGFGSKPAAPSRAMLAILPFANLEKDPAQEYFCDGVTEEIILQVGRVNPARLGVIARTSSMHYKGTLKRVDAIARELAVRYVLEGTVRRSGNRVRIAARLVRGEDQTPLWAESYERNVANVFEIQTEVARRIADSLAIELLPRAATDGGFAGTRASASAYEAYLKGRYYWNRRGPTDLERAVTLLEEAVATDQTFAGASAALADALNVLPWYGLRRPKDAYPRSKEMARRALALDEQSAAAHTALAYAYHYYDWNWADAEREYHRALELNPNYAQAHQWLAAHYAEMGRTDEALAEMRNAERLDPRSLIIQAGLGWINYLGRRFEPAIAQLTRTLKADPDFVPARLWLGQTLEAVHRPQEALDHYLHVRRLAGAAPSGLGELARGYAAAGKPQEARAAIAQLLDIAQTRYVEADLIARAYEGLGDRDRALEWLDRGIEERAVKMVQIGVDPQFDGLRAEPRFRDLVRRLNLPD